MTMAGSAVGYQARPATSPHLSAGAFRNRPISMTNGSWSLEPPVARTLAGSPRAPPMNVSASVNSRDAGLGLGRVEPASGRRRGGVSSLLLLAVAEAGLAFYVAFAEPLPRPLLQATGAVVQELLEVGIGIDAAVLFVVVQGPYAL
jgi:hypothetical protein